MRNMRRFRLLVGSAVSKINDVKGTRVCRQKKALGVQDVEQGWRIGQSCSGRDRKLRNDLSSRGLKMLNEGIGSCRVNSCGASVNGVIKGLQKKSSSLRASK